MMTVFTPKDWPNLFGSRSEARSGANISIPGVAGV